MVIDPSFAQTTKINIIIPDSGDNKKIKFEEVEFKTKDTNKINFKELRENFLFGL